MNQLKYFKIKNLYGYKNYDIRFVDNTLILVGENGSGKTTILRLLYYFISGQWSALVKFNFDSLSIKIDNSIFTIKNSELTSRFDITNKRLLRHFPPHLRNKFIRILEEYDGNNLTLSELEMICNRYDIPFHLILREFDFANESINHERLSNKLNEIKDALGEIQVLYLPTYRRIEQELSSIFKGIDEDELRHRKHLFMRHKKLNYTELIEFGMRDVVQSINGTLNKLKEFARESLNSLTLGYLGDVVDEKYEEVDVSQIKEASDEMITNILDRIDTKILSVSSKKHLSKTIEDVKRGESLTVHAKVICHYFIKLLNFQQELNNKEQKIKKFCDVCSDYMEDKIFKYTSSSFNFEILPKKDLSVDTKITLDQLSSGEKQIVSLFSHLYLSDENKYFVMIDEPELSLSVPWQRKFLVDIKKGDFCVGLIAVTHSPFIYDNELDSFARGLGEFLTVRK